VLRETEPLVQPLDELQQLVLSIALLASEPNKLAGAFDHRALGGRPGHADSTTPLKIQEAVIPKDAKRSEDSVLVDARYGRKVLSRRQPVARHRLA